MCLYGALFARQKPKVRKQCLYITPNQLFRRVMATKPKYRKTETLNLRVSTGFRAALQLAAKKEHRSPTNMVEHLVWDYCERNGISLEQGGMDCRNLTC